MASRKEIAPYFRHDAEARNDHKIQGMMCAYGWEGYGWWWCIVETLRAEDGYKLPDKPYIYASLARQWGCTEDRARDFVNDLITKYELLSLVNGCFFSPSLIRRMESFEQRRAQNSQNALSRWERDATAMQPHCERNATAMLSIVENSIGEDSTQDKEEKDLFASEPLESKNEETIYAFPCKGGNVYKVTPSIIRRYSELYPSLNVLDAMADMYAWLVSNPSKTKTKNGYGKFINSWLMRAKDKQSEAKLKTKPAINYPRK